MKAFKTCFDSKNSFVAEPNYIIDNFITRDENLGFSVVRTHLNGSHPLMKNINSHRSYYFLSGYAKFLVDGDEFEVKEGEMITIMKNTTYKFEGKFDALLISCPAFNPDDDVIFK